MTLAASDIGVVLVGGMRSHQENYAAAFAASGCRLLAVGLVEGEDETRHAALARQFGIPMLPLDEAIRLKGATVASIAVRMPYRVAAATSCAGAGLHLYFDKPLAGSPADAATIAAAVGEAGVRAQVFSHVSAGWARDARDMLRGGRLGRILAVHADMLMAKGTPTASVPAHPRIETAAPMNFPDDIAKREMTDMGVYPVSFVAWLLGSRALTVNAVTANHFFAEHLSHDVEDYGAMLVAFQGGVSAAITCGRTGWDSMPGPFLARAILVGDKGSAVFGTEQAAQLRVMRPGPKPRDIHPDDPMGMWLSTQRSGLSLPVARGIDLQANRPNDVAAFVAALTSSAEQGIGAAAAVHHCEVLAAAYRSAAESRAIEVTDQSPAGPR